MTAFKIVLVCVVCSLLVNWIRSGKAFPIVQALPLLGGHAPGLYDIGGLVLLWLALWGASRLRRRGRGDDD